MNRERNPHVQVIPFALKEFVRFYVNGHIQVAGSPTIPPGVTLAGDT